MEVTTRTWTGNRPAASDLFTIELERALLTLGDAPAVGTRYVAGAAVVRRLLLRQTRYHLYYFEHDDRVHVVAAWSALRGRGPRL